LWHDLLLYSGLNKHTSNKERCVSYGNDEMPFILQPATQDRKMLSEIVALLCLKITHYTVNNTIL
jgi:hypothetical protein